MFATVPRLASSSLKADERGSGEVKFVIDAWTLDKPWLEEDLHPKLFNPFKDRLSNPNE